MRTILKAVLASSFLVACASTAATPPEPQWRSLFNGRDLDGWKIKFAGHPLGENIHNTFSVRDGVIHVSYDGYEKLDGQFGHLFYPEPFSHYRLRFEYRFIGEQVAGSPTWGLRNNGVMIHSQPPETMTIDQPFPTSVEVQVLGSDGVTPRTTANVCTPGISILLNGVRSEEHCFNSAAPSPPPGEWASIEVEVHGNRLIRHIVNGQVVMEYSEPLLDEDSSWSPTRALSSGYLAFQAESHPTEIRNVEIMVLDE
jgi:hypothetical protein